jgi:hypothetical protein
MVTGSGSVSDSGSVSNTKGDVWSKKASEWGDPAYSIGADSGTKYVTDSSILSVYVHVYVLGSEMCPLLPQNNALVLRRAPERADPDQPTETFFLDS